MNKIEIKDLYLVFGPEKQKAFRMLKERKRKNEILKATITIMPNDNIFCTVLPLRIAPTVSLFCRNVIM